MATMKNSEIFEAVRAFSPQFKSLTSKVTANMLDSNGVEAINAIDPTILNSWFNLTLRVVLQKVDIARARNPLEKSGIVESYRTPNGGYAQRLAVEALKPTSPKFKGLTNGSSVDMQKVRLPKATERFFKLNWAFQNYYTLQDYQVKQIFASEFGMSEFVGGIVAQMENSYKKQKYVNALEVLSAGINSEVHPLKDTQKVELSSWTDGAPTNTELQELIKVMKNLKTELEASPSTSAFNAAGFDTAVDSDRMVAMIRAGIQTDIQAALTTGSLYGFDKEFLDMPFEVQEVLNFGGLIPYVDSTYAVRLYPVYSPETGEQIGWATTENDTEVEVENGEEVYKDPNADVLAVIIQKGAIFETVQNPVQVIPAPYNAAGLYQTFWFSQADNGINFDYYYNVIVIKKPAAGGDTSIAPIGG